MPIGKNLYFVAIVPTDSIASQIILLKKEIAERFETKAALKSPPHITLIPPFSLEPENEPIVHDILNSAPKIQTGIQLKLQGISSFAPRVIYIKISPNNDLIHYQKNLKTYFYEKSNLKVRINKNNEFTAHMTLAFRDLKPEAYFEAMDIYSHREIYFEFEVESFHLLKHNGSTGWELYKEYKLIQGL